MHPVKDGVEVQRHQLVKFLDGGFVRGGVEAAAGIVVDHVKAAALGRDALHHGLDFGRIGDIRDSQGALAACLL